MKCPICKATIAREDISAFYVSDTATELRAKCDCGKVFFAFVEHHDQWHDLQTDELVNLRAEPLCVIGGAR